MSECLHCRHELTGLHEVCPECGAEWPGVDPGGDVAGPGSGRRPDVPIARFTNVAEAGYFHCELEGRLSNEVRLTTENQFDAASASWWTRFVLSVPADDAERARTLLKQLLDESEPDQSFDSSDWAVGAPPAADPELPLAASRIHWTPILLTLTAGTFVVWAAKQVHRQLREPARGQARQVHLWDQLGRDGGRWVQSIPGGAGRRELSIDPAGRQATLREDRDGDGVFEQSTRLTLNHTPGGR